MNEEDAQEMLTILRSMDWKLWEMYNMMRNVLDIDDEEVELDDEEDDND